MKFSMKVVASALALMAGAAFAETEPTDPTEVARVDLMKSFGGAAKVLGGMAGGTMAFDAAAAEAAKAVLVSGAADITAKFEADTMDPASKASPDIWTKWDDFTGKAKGLADAATTLDVSSADSLGAGMAAIGGACKACHSSYRLQ